jgi:quinol monooxygenase YgiN
MAHVLVRHKVTDFATWKPIYDAHGATRKASGCRQAWLFRNAENPNEAVILFEWSDLESARRFIGSEDLRQTMTRAGVADRPDIYFLDEVGRSSA